MHLSRSLSRRVFLSGSLGALAIQAGARAPQAAGPRTSLAEPGPMIPPMPALLLTVVGSDGPDEITVVWSFVVNGKPPQIGISVHDHHVAGKLIAQHQEFVLNLPTTGLITLS